MECRLVDTKDYSNYNISVHADYYYYYYSRSNNESSGFCLRSLYENFFNPREV